MPTYTISYVASKKPPIKEYAFILVTEKWGKEAWKSFEIIVDKESKWEEFGPHYPVTKLSSAHGLCGFLNQTWIDTGFVKTEDPHTQISACIVYVEKRHQTPQQALKFHLQENWF